VQQSITLTRYAQPTEGPAQILVPKKILGRRQS
jgi:hypothetical protein